MSAERGKFVVLEGIDGAGKSVQTQRLQQHLTERGIECVATREPGGSALGEKIRAWLKHDDLDAVTEALLFNAARRQHVRDLLAPTLAQGTWVVCDRFALSGFAYQGAGGADLNCLEALHRIACSDIAASKTNSTTVTVDLGFLLDLPAVEAQTRLAEKGKVADAFERRGRVFFESVRKLFVERAEKEPDIWHILDARASIEEVTEQIRNRIERRFFPTGQEGSRE